MIIVITTTTTATTTMASDTSTITVMSTTATPSMFTYNTRHNKFSIAKCLLYGVAIANSYIGYSETHYIFYACIHTL